MVDDSNKSDLDLKAQQSDAAATQHDTAQESKAPAPDPSDPNPSDPAAAPVEAASPADNDIEDQWFSEPAVADNQVKQAPTATATELANAPDSIAPDSKAPDSKDKDLDFSPESSSTDVDTNQKDDTVKSSSAKSTPPEAETTAQEKDPQGQWDGESNDSARIMVDASLFDNDDQEDNLAPWPQIPPKPATPLAAPLPTPPEGSDNATPSPEQIEAAKQRISLCEHEAIAFAKDPRAANLWFEVGQLYENTLANPRQAATAYQAAFQNNPRFTPVVQAARRLFTQIGNWPMVEQLLSAEQAASEDPKTQSILALRRGHILASKLDKAADAEQAYLQALDLDPNNSAALDRLAYVLRSAGRWSELASLLVTHKEVDAQTHAVADVLLQAAWIHEFKLNDVDTALNLWRQVSTLAPQNREAAQAQVRLLENRDQHQQYVEDLVQLAKIETGERRIGLLILAARVSLKKLNDAEQARRLLERAKLESPRNLLLLRELADLLASTQNFAALADVLLEQAACTTDAQARVALHTELGRLYEEQLNQPDQAIEQFQKVASLDPKDQPAFISLGRLYFRQGQFRALVDLYDTELAAIDEAPLRIGRLFKVAELLQHQLGDIEAAVQRYREIISIDPSYLPAHKALTEILVQGERWQDLIEVYEAELSLTEDRDQRIFLLDRIGTFYDEKLGEIDKSIETFARILHEVPNYLPAIRTLARMYTKAERYTDLIQIHEREAQAIEDPKQVVALKFRTGEIYENLLGDQDQAVEIYQQVLSLSPNYLPALKSLGRIYHRQGQYQALIAMNRQELEVSQDPTHQATLLFKIGELYAEKLNQNDKAAEAYREVLRLVPSYHPALRALVKLAQRQGDDEALIKLNKQECDVLEVQSERAVARCRAALAEEFDLSDDARALQTYQLVRQDDDGLCLANLAVARLAQRSDKSDDAITVLQHVAETSPINASREAALRDLTQILAFQSNDYAGALSACERLLATQSQDLQTLRTALLCAEQVHDYPRAISLAQQLATLVETPKQAANLYENIARWKVDHLDPPGDPLAEYLKLLEYAPTHSLALLAVENRYLQAAFHEGLYAIKLRALEASKPGPAQVTMLLQLADLSEGPLAKQDQAIELLQRALDQDPHSTLVLRRLKALYKALGRTQDQLRIVALEADASPDPKAAVQHLLEIGRLQEEETQDFGSAADCYLLVLGKEPNNNEAFARADRLLGQLNRHQDLAKLYHDRVQITEALPTKVGLLLRAAQLEKDRLEDPALALASYQEALALNPQHVTALIGAADIALSMDDHAQAQSLYSRAVQFTQDPSILNPIYERIGDLFDVHLGQPDQAVQAYLATLALRPNDPALLGKLGDIYLAKQAWTEASDVLAKRLTFSTDNPAKLDALYKLAQIYETGLGNPAQAAQFLEQALGVSPNSMQTIQRLSALYKRSQDWSSLAATLERLAKATPSNEKDKLVTLYRELAQLFEGPLGQQDKAITAYQSLVALAPNDRSARYRLATGYSMNAATRVQAIEEFRILVPQAPAQVEVYRKLHELFAAEGAHDKRYLACEILDLLGAINDDEAFYFADNRKRASKGLKHGLTEARHETLVVHPDENALVRQIIQACADQLSKVIPGNLDNFSVGRGDRLGPKSTESVRVMMDQLAHTLTDNKLAFDVYRCSTKRLALGLENTDPPALIVGNDIVRNHKTQEQRFLLGRLVESRISGHYLIADMNPVKLASFLSAIGLAIQPQFPTLPTATVDEDLSRRIGKALSRGARKVLTPLIDDLATVGPEIDLAAHLQAIPLTQVRAGVLLANSLSSTLRLMARDLGVKIDPSDHEVFGQQLMSQPLMREILTYAISDSYAQARQDLHLAIDA